MKKIFLLMLVTMFSIMVFAQDKKITEIKPAQLPKGASTWVSQNLSGGKIVRAGKIEEKGVISYAAVVEFRGQKHSYLFDKDGKFTGKGDNMLKNEASPAKPPVKTTETKPAAK